MRFNQNPSIGSRVFLFGRTDMMKLIVAFRSFSNAPKNTHSAITIKKGTHVDLNFSVH